MKRRKPSPAPEDLRLDPEARLAPKFDACSIRKDPAPEERAMGFRVLDNCAEENQK